MPCDFVLLEGSAIVNESMLTGESIPVIKNPTPHTNDSFNPVEDAKYILFAGTKIIQARPPQGGKVYAMVIRTGFLTLKGGLVRDILYPKPNKFKFYRDSYIFVACLAMVAIIGFIVTIPFMIS